MPTILQLAGKTIPGSVDGTSFVPLLTNPTQPWRKRYFLQYLQEGLGVDDITAYDGIRTSLDDTVAPDSLFTQYTTGETELYHYQNDPNAIQNLGSVAAWKSQVNQLHGMISQWKTCTGQQCHNLEFN